MINALQILRDRIAEFESTLPGGEYRVPSLWIQDSPEGESLSQVHPVTFFREAIDNILSRESEAPEMQASSGEWTKDAVVYNIFTRLTTAWDHDGDGRIALDDLEGGLRETGTFLKSIAILPYLKSLGINTLHLLPVTAIGQDGNKGSLGSPYAIRNPYKLDDRLCEPFHELGVESEYAAFVEAAHHLGMRVVMEFVFRTASKDSDWILDHPNWFYWIDAEIPDRSEEQPEGYGNPQFSEDELQVINQRVRRHDHSSLPPPGMAYRNMFHDMPMEIVQEGDRYIGLLEDGKRLRIPGAFADWPPDDVQPPWNDVTYLKLYDHSSFNYIAYNTIRIYDSRLTQIDNENRGLWNTIINIIPHYQKNFGIDGVMIDMGHALPKRLKQSIVDRARKVDPDFAFWEENFAISVKSRQEGYNATVGYLWTDEHIPEKLREFLTMLESQDVPVPFFATPEMHNTPRAAKRECGMAFSRLSLVVNAFLPAVLFLHQGYELGETFPVNTGLGFTPEDIAELPSHTLPLFSESALSWTNDQQMSALVARIIAIRRIWHDIVVNPSKNTIKVFETTNPRVLCFVRQSLDGTRAVAVLANTNCTGAEQADVWLDAQYDILTDEISAAEVGKNDQEAYSLSLEPGQCMVFELRTPKVEIEEFTP
ncbi:MAG: alpha-amylase [Ignavibacteria bacterium]|nr:MAG: alpha-amylase [Ignavibacteria bacterium]